MKINAIKFQLNITFVFPFTMERFHPHGIQKEVDIISHCLSPYFSNNQHGMWAASPKIGIVFYATTRLNAFLEIATHYHAAFDTAKIVKVHRSDRIPECVRIDIPNPAIMSNNPACIGMYLDLYIETEKFTFPIFKHHIKNIGAYPLAWVESEFEKIRANVSKTYLQPVITMCKSYA